MAVLGLFATLLCLTVSARAAATSYSPGVPDVSGCSKGVITSTCCPDCFGKLPNAYTLTAIKSGKDAYPYNGGKVQGSGFGLFSARVGSYCPFTGAQASNCPNGTDMALSGTMHPLSLVPGGQDLYVAYDGEILITTQHSHSFPPNSYPYYYGWSWTAYQAFPPTAKNAWNGIACPRNNDKYNCNPPTGYWNFKAPGATVGGLKACKSPYNPATMSVWAVTPGFKETGCVDLDGLGTHNYTGPNPPVWAY